MGFWSKILGIFRRKKKTSANGQAGNGHTAAMEADLQPQCAALTSNGAQCKRSSRQGSKYCASHKGYRPPAAETASAAEDTKPVVARAKDTAPSARGNAGTVASRPQCAALTASGGQCARSARQGSKYCGSHKGYRPPAATVAATAMDTKPKARNARDTAPAGRRTHVTHNGYKLYQKGNRYFFSKKSQSEAKADGANPVYEMPADRQVTETPNGLPILKKA